VFIVSNTVAFFDLAHVDWTGAALSDGTVTGDPWVMTRTQISLAGRYVHFHWLNYL